MLILTEGDMRRAMSMDDAIAATADALQSVAAGTCYIPLRGKVHTPGPNDGTTLFMYGSVPAASALGVKLYAEFPRNAEKDLPVASATVVLLDATTGRVEALLDGTYLTQLRTGASSGVATRELARGDARTMALVGCGSQAWSQLEAVLAVRPVETVYVCSRHEESARRFAKAETARLERLQADGIAAGTSSDGGSSAEAGTKPEAALPHLVPTTDISKAVSRADVVTCVTTAAEPVFEAAAVRPGTHVNAVGSYTPQMSELPGKLITNADAVYLDTPDALQESGDLLKPLASGAWDRSNLAGTIGDVLLGHSAGRTCNHTEDRDRSNRITVYESVGSAALDLVVGQRMVERARDLGLGTEVEF